MAAPAYTTDLVDITLAESTTNWSALGGGASGLSASPDLSMQGTNCVDKQVTGAEKGQVFDFGSGITPGANEHFYVWAFVGTPGLTASLVNRGLCVVMGTSTSAYVQYHVEGNDTYGAAGRVGRCYPVRYTLGASGSPPYRTAVGLAGASPQFFGATVNITASVKGSNLGVDAIRRGTGVLINDGEVADPATFAGLAAVNDSVSNRWGVFTRLLGSTYELQGELNIGSTSAAYCVDQGATILLADVPHCLATFHRIVIGNAGTVVDWSSVTFEAAGATSVGSFNVIHDATSVTLSSCNFVNFGWCVLRPGVSTSLCTWRGCDTIFAYGGAILNATVSDSTATSAMLWDDFGDIDGKLDGTVFKSSGVGHGLELGPNTLATVGMKDVNFDGYAVSDGSTGNEALYNNSGKHITINRSGGSPFSVRNGTGSTTTVNATVSLTIEANVSLVGAEIRIYDLDTSPPDYGTELAGTESHNAATYAYGGSSGNVIMVQIMLAGYEEFVAQTTMPSVSGTQRFTLVKELNA